MASYVHDGWEFEASRVVRRRLAFVLPVLLALTVLAFVLVVRRERVSFAPGALFGLFGLVLFSFGAASAALWYLTRPGIGSALLSPLAVLPRADRKAALARIRRGEPGETAEEARSQLTLAERLRSQWWVGPVCLLIGLRSLADAIGGHGGGGPWLSATFALMCLAAAPWTMLYRRGALRSIDAIRRRWGAV